MCIWECGGSLLVPEHDVYGRGNHFSLPAYVAGQTTSVYTNAPPGLLFHGDPGIPLAYANGSYLDFAPRVGLAWDPRGDGKMSVRASYGIFFDAPESFTNADFSTGSPWGNTLALTAPRLLANSISKIWRQSVPHALSAEQERDLQPGRDIY